jgi:hypothetical protein
VGKNKQISEKVFYFSSEYDIIIISRKKRAVQGEKEKR